MNQEDPRTALLSVLIVLTLLSSCMPQQQAATPSLPASTPTIVTPPSETPPPTPTPAPTATATPALPVGVGTPLPGVSEPITPKSAQLVKLLAIYTAEVGGWDAWGSVSGFEFTSNGTSLQLKFAGAGSPGSGCTIVIGQVPICAKGRIIMGTDGEFYTTSGPTDHKLQLWRGVEAKGDPVLSFDWQGRVIQPVAVDAKNGLFFYGTSVLLYSSFLSNALFVRDINTGHVVEKLNLPGESAAPSVEAVTFSASSNYVTFSIPNSDPMTGPLFDLFDLQTHRTKLQLINLGISAFSPDEKTLIAFRSLKQLSKAPYKSFDVPTRTPSSRYPTMDISTDAAVTAAKFSPDGSILAVGFSDGSLQLLDTADGSSLRHWKAGDSAVAALAFTQDMRYLASAFYGGTVQIWGAWP